MATKKKIGKKLTALIIACLVFIVIAGLHLAGAFRSLENISYDMRVRFWANTSFSHPSDEIIVILLDQDSLDWAQNERGWGWPWPRQAYAEIVDYMNISNANAVIFDVIFSEPSIYYASNQDEIISNAARNLNDTQAAAEAISRLNAREDDASFVNASRNYGHVVQTVMFSSLTGNTFSWPADLSVPLFRLENFENIVAKFSVGQDEKAQLPIQGLRNSAAALGSITGIPDSDGIIRRLKPFTLFDGKAVPGLSLASLLVSGKSPNIYYNSKKSAIEWDGLSIPIDKDGSALLRYRGLVDKYVPYRAMDIILSAEAYERGDNLEVGIYTTRMGTEWVMYTPANFSGAYAFFGFYAQGLFDIFNTPIASIYPGMGCHITMLDNILQNDFIRESAELTNLLILLAVAAVTVFFTMFFNRIALSVTSAAAIAIIVITGSFAAYQFGGLWIPMITYLTAVIAGFAAVTLYNYATEGSQKRFIKSAFSQYLSPKVIDQIIADPSQLKLGGEKREMTAIFSDIRSFSTISEALGDPSKLVDLLNFYLTKLSNIVMDHQGTIDKYEGDAIIAFFGAPIHMKNHASLACRAVVNMKKAEKELNREALEIGLITKEVMIAMSDKGIISSVDDPYPIFTRLGINTGDMVVGNMGTPNKMDYTIMGNAVNLAARLEGVNKQYDTGGMLISEYTRNSIGDEFIIRRLSKVRVVGINTPIRLYELLDIASAAEPKLLEMVKLWEQAFDFYESRNFTAAYDIFKGICSGNDKDMAAKKYLKRCETFIKSPLDEKTWDNGVDNLTEK